jgi:hypothetical protein
VNGGPQSVLPVATAKAEGASKQAAQQPKMAKLPGRDLASAVSGEQEGAWARAQGFVRETCIGAIEQIAQSSSDNQIKPIPARWNLAPRDGGGPPAGALPTNAAPKARVE